jgi:hypothetical protein
MQEQLYSYLLNAFTQNAALLMTYHEIFARAMVAVDRTWARAVSNEIQRRLSS